MSNIDTCTGYKSVAVTVCSFPHSPKIHGSIYSYNFYCVRSVCVCVCLCSTRARKMQDCCGSDLSASTFQNMFKIFRENIVFDEVMVTTTAIVVGISIAIYIVVRRNFN